MSTTVRDIYEFIDSIAPFRTQESWDNSGFLVGDVSKEVTKVAVCLDVTHDTLQKAADFGADLLVSHHPVIFHPMKGLREQTPGTEAIVYDAIRKGNRPPAPKPSSMTPSARTSRSCRPTPAGTSRKAVSMTSSRSSSGWRTSKASYRTRTATAWSAKAA